MAGEEFSEWDNTPAFNSRIGNMYTNEAHSGETAIGWRKNLCDRIEFS